MTDYYPLLAKAVAGLDKSTGEARRALYERARNALVAQLRGADPPLSESEITRERLALEEAVRRVEADAARQMRAPAPERPAGREPGPPADEPPAPNRPGREAFGPEPAPRSSPAPRADTSAEPGVRGLRDVVAEAEGLGAASAQASRSAREAYAATPREAPGLDRIEPERPRRPAPPPAGEPRGDPRYAEPPAEGAAYGAPPRRRPAGPLPRGAPDFEEEEGRRHTRRGFASALMALLVVGGTGAAAYWQRDRISAWFGAVRSPAPPTAPEQAQQRPKSADRVTQDGQPSTQQQSGQQPAVVAQRVVLYEDDPNNPQGHRFVGSALWRTETVSPGPERAPELAIRCDVEVPERRLAMTMSFRRNTEASLPASHTVEILFNLPADFAMGGVASVPGLLMKEAEEARGAPLSGQAVKVTNGFFLIGLSSAEGDLARNLQLLKERAWFDIPMIYNNGRRAILAIEKGNPGERVFKEAFAAWGK